MAKNTMLRGAALVVALTGLTMTTSTSVQADPGTKVTICHIPPGNPENAHEITVDESAVEAHFTQHGDHFGFCSPE